MDFKVLSIAFLTSLVTFIIYFVGAARNGWIFNKEGNPSWGMVMISIAIFILLFILAILIASSTIKKNIQEQLDRQAIKSLFESSKEFGKLSHEDELAYQAIVSQIFNELQPHAKIRINDVIEGLDSKTKRIVDISIRSKFNDKKMITIIKTYVGAKSVDISEINDFYSILKDVRASKGIIISNAGFSQAAKSLAPSYGIDLCSIIDAKSRHWKDDIKIPILYIKLRPNMHFHCMIHFEKGDTLSRNPISWTISTDAGKTKKLLVDLFTSLWNENKISRTPEIDQKIDFDFSNFSILVSDKKWVTVKDCIWTYRVEQEGYLYYLEPEEYRAIKNHLSGDIEPSSILMKFKILKDPTQGIKINDAEDFKKRTKGLLVILEEQINNLNNTSKETDVLIKRVGNP